MKKHLLLIITILSSTLLFGQDLQNGGFNNWTINTHGGGYPTEWTSSVSEFGVLFPGVYMLEKSSDASNLSSSLKLNTSVIGTDTIFSFALIGGIANEGPSGGYPFTTAIDSVVFDAKFDLLETDSANVLVILKNGGSPIDMQIFQIGGTQSNWTRYAFAVNQFNFTPDSLIIGFTSGDINNNEASAGSWFMVDNLRFKDGATETTGGLPNPSFENWTPITSETPDDWYTYNEYTSPTGFATAIKTASASEGSYAIELRPDTLQNNNDRSFIEGMMIYGYQDLMNQTITGKPFVASPSNFTGMYKWAPNGTDTANIGIVFTLLGSYVGYANLEIINDQASFTAFDMPITLGDAPDSVLIMINGGKAGSVLTIDNLEFNGGNVGVKSIQLSEGTSGIYPNPTSSDSHLRIGLTQASTVDYIVVNALGQFMSSNEIGQKDAGVHSLLINSSTYKPGVYFVKVTIDKKETTHKLIVK